MCPSLHVRRSCPPCRSATVLGGQGAGRVLAPWRLRLEKLLRRARCGAVGPLPRRRRLERGVVPGHGLDLLFVQRTGDGLHDAQRPTAPAVTKGPELPRGVFGGLSLEE